MRKTSTYARKRAHKDAFARTRHEVINPVTEAVIRSRIEEDIQRLRTAVGLQAYIGEDAAMVANMAGRLVYVTCHAARLHGLGETPEARILAGTANALADIAETPAELERQRGAVIAGLQAIDRLMPKLHTFSIAAGSLELDNLLNTANGMGTADVRRALAHLRKRKKGVGQRMQSGQSQQGHRFQRLQDQGTDMTDNTQHEALGLADWLDDQYDPDHHKADAAAELRRLHAENAALQQGYDAARLEIEALRDEVKEYRHGAGVQKALIETLLADKPEDALDAARYRMLRRGQHWSVINGVGDTLRAEELDAAIDAARSKAKEGDQHG